MKKYIYCKKIKEHLLNGLNQKMLFLFYRNSRDSYLKSMFPQLNSEYNIDNKFSFKINQSTWNTMSEEIECQLLKLGDTSWKSGKLRF